MPISGADVVANNIKEFGGGFTRHVSKVMKKAVDRLDKDVTLNMSMTDHSLQR